MMEVIPNFPVSPLRNVVKVPLFGSECQPQKVIPPGPSSRPEDWERVATKLKEETLLVKDFSFFHALANRLEGKQLSRVEKLSLIGFSAFGVLQLMVTGSLITACVDVLTLNLFAFVTVLAVEYFPHQRKTRKLIAHLEKSPEIAPQVENILAKRPRVISHKLATAIVQAKERNADKNMEAFRSNIHQVVQDLFKS